MKPIAWYDPTNGMVSTDKDSPLFTPLGQVLPLYTQRTWVRFEEKDMPKGDNPMFDHEYFIAGMVYAEMILKEKNNG